MTKTIAVLVLLTATLDLTACTSADKNATGTTYVGRFDNDENRLPMLLNNQSGAAPPSIIYGDGEH
jgi:hypothetical protein